MSWFTGKPLSTTARVLAVEFGALDCEDTDFVHVWLSVPAWSTRRAFLVGGDAFYREFKVATGNSAHWVDSVLTRRPQRYLTVSAAGLIDKYFYVSLIGPPDEAEAGERIEFSRIKLCPSTGEVNARLEV